MFFFASIYDVFPFKQLIDVNEAILKFWHNDIGLSWGASIIGLTVVVRLLILPLTYKQVRSMQAMQRLQPELKKLQQRYKDDKQRLNEEVMKFYREHQVNPLGSCLPLVLQLPFFFSLYGLQRSGSFKSEVHVDHGQKFLFIPDITQPLTHHIPALIVLLALYVATQLCASLITSVNIQDRNQRLLMLGMPFFFLVIVWRFPAGLLVYWITTNVWTIGQQLVVRRFMPPPQVAPAPAGAAALAGAGSKRPPPTDGKAQDDGRSKGRAKAEEAAEKSPAAARSGNGGGPQKAPPRSPRKRKKRSGRRR